MTTEAAHDDSNYQSITRDEFPVALIQAYTTIQRCLHGPYDVTG